MIESLIDKLMDLNIGIELLEEDRLKIHADMSSLPPGLLEEIRMNKEGLVKYLKEQEGDEDFEQIVNVPLQESYVLSPAQKRLWILSQVEEGNIAYNMPGVFQFEGELDRAALDQAFRSLIARHESLRTVFREDGKGGVRQVIRSVEETAFQVRYADLRDAEDKNETAAQVAQEDFVRPFDLSSGPLVRAALCRLADKKWVLSYVVHHIISDGWSMSILLKELLQLYSAHVAGKANPLPPLRIQYKDYAAWQQQQLSGKALNTHREYWLSQFEGSLPVLELPADYNRPSVRTYNGALFSRAIPARLGKGIRELSQEEGGTLFMGMLAAVNALLYRYTSQEDIIIGTPVAGREHVDIENQIGFYVNTLALRTRFNGGKSFRELLRNTRQVVLGAYEHQMYPFDELVVELNLQRDISRNPLFDILLIVDNAEDGQQHHGSGSGRQVSKFEVARRSTSVFDMVFHFVETATELQADIIYNTDIYSSTTVEQIATHLEQMLAAIIGNPDQQVSLLDFLSDADRHKLLVTFNDTAADYPADETLLDLFARQAAGTPDLGAVVCGNKKLTYRELDERSSHLAACLVNDYSIESNELVGVLLGRSEQLVIAMLGIMKAGGVYMPIDPVYPDARKRFIIKDTGIKLLISDAENMPGKTFFEGSLISMDAQAGTAAPAAPAWTPRPGDLAYVIYTSGSTGEPKGVMLEHGAAYNSMRALQSVFGIKEGDKCLQVFSPSFDASVFECFIALISGGCLCMVGEEEKRTPALLEDYLSGLDMATLPPAYLKMLDMGRMRGLKKLLTGGEAPSADKVLPFTTHGTYYNGYGPTESAVCVSVFNLTKAEEIRNGTMPIGKPVPNVQLYILDGHLNLVPVGVAGEICIGGKSLARGYLNRPGLTAEKFVPSPFTPGGKIYRTGDMGRWLPDGNIEFLGRKDEQIKVRGYRIEPGEIEAALQSYEDIDSSVVVGYTGNWGETELVAYITGRKELNASDIRSYLAGVLPSYMLPGHYIQLAALPLTAIGKVDKKNLPKPEETAPLNSAEYVAPRNILEEKMVRIWEEHLGRKRIGVMDDFFELGGSSLNAMMVVKKLVDETGHAIPIKELFKGKTIENIAKYIGSREKPEPEPAVAAPVVRQEATLFDLSCNQRIYFSGYRIGNEIVRAFYELGHLDMDAFRFALAELVRRQEALRTVFVSGDGNIRQRVLSMEELQLQIPDPVPVSSAEEMNSLFSAGKFREFDLGTFPLFFCRVYKIAGGNYHILFTTHHIITDGYSAGILVGDLGKLYTARLQNKMAEPGPAFQYRDFCAWQRSFLDSAEGMRHKEYWLEKLKGYRPMEWTSLLPGENLSAADETHRFTGIIGGELSARVEQFVKEHNLTRTVLLMGVLNLLASRLSGQDDVLLVTNVSGRNSRYYGKLDVSGLIGFFANPLLVRTSVDPGCAVAEHLLAVRDNFLDDLGYQDYPFWKLVQELPDTNPAELLASSVFFNYTNYQYNRETVYKPENEDLEVFGTGEYTGYAFGLAVREYSNCLRLDLLFTQRMFSSSFALEAGRQFFSLLENVLEHPSLPVWQLVGANAVAPHMPTKGHHS